MKKFKKFFVTSIVLVFAFFFLASCDKPVDSHEVLEKPAVVQDDTVFTWNALDDVTGYVVSINDEIKGIGNPVINAENGNFCQYQLDTANLANGSYAIKFASYIFTEDGETVYSEWSSVFTLVWPKEYVVATPVVDQDNISSFVWNSVEGVDGYLVKIDDKEINIGNPVSSSEFTGSRCYYELDEETLGEGKHIVMFASYVYDEAGQMVKSAWTKEFDVFNLVSLSQAEVYDYSSYYFELYCPTETIKLVFNGTIEATYTDPYEEQIGHNTIHMSKFVFTEELVDKTNYVVEAYAVNKYGECDVLPTKFVLYYEAPEAYEAPIGYNTFGYNPVFIFEEELDQPIFSLKVNEVEYIINYLVDDVTTVQVMDLLDTLEDADEIFTKIYSGETVKFALKVVDAINYVDRPAGEYSADLEFSFKVTEDQLEEVLIDIEVQYSNILIPMIAITDDVTIAYAEDTFTYKLTINDEEVAPALQYENELALNIGYELAEHLVFGDNNVKLTISSEVFGISDFVLYENKISIADKVEGLRISGTELVWDFIDLVEEYKVQILGSDDSVKETFTCKKENAIDQLEYWDTTDYDGLNQFKVVVVPVLNGEDGKQSIAMNIERPAAPTTSVMKQVEDELVFTADLGKTLLVEVIDKSTNLTVLTQQTNIPEYPVTVDLFSLYSLDLFDIELTYLGNGVTTVNSVTTVFECTTSNVLNYTIKDTESIKVEGAPEGSSLQVNFITEDYVMDEDGYFNVLAYADENDENQIYVTYEIESLSEDTVNVIPYPIYIDLTTYRAVAPIFDYSEEVIDTLKWYGDAYNTYEWSLYSVSYESDEEVLTLVETGRVTGVTLPISQELPVGMYKITVKTIGNGMIFNSTIEHVYYEVIAPELLVVTPYTVNDYNSDQYYNVKILTDKFDVDIILNEYGYTLSKYVVSGVLNNEDPTIYDYYYHSFYASSVYYYAADEEYNPIVEFDYIGVADFCNAVPASFDVNIQKYHVENYYYGSSRYTNDFYGVNDETPEIIGLHYENNVVSSLPIIVESEIDGYDYMVATFMDYTGGDYVYSYEYAPGYYYEFKHVTFDFTNAVDFAGFDGKLFANVDSSEAWVNTMYVLKGTDLVAHLAKYLPLPEGYAYYSDVACTTLLADTVIEENITVYVGLVPAE